MPLTRERVPTPAKVAAAVILGALAILFAHDGLKLPYPGLAPASWWNWLYNAIEVAATGFCGARAVVRRRDRGAWIAITLGLAFFTAGDMYYSLVFGDSSNVPFPSVADALYLSFYPFAYLGIGLLLRGRVRRLPAGLWLDGAIGGLAVAAVGAAVVFGAALTDTHGAPLTVATNLAYPLADLLLVGILLGIMALTGWNLRGDWLMLAVGFVVFAIVDSIYLLQTANDTYVSNTILDVGWPAAMAIVASAAWRAPGRVRSGAIEGWGTFSIPALAAVACLVLEFLDHYHPVALVAHVLATVCLLAVIVRLGLSFAENLSMLRASRRDAITDALTGLGNRRAVKLELAERLSHEQVGPFVLAYYDLDGFKGYNDTFGHQAGDSLLTRLGDRAKLAVPEASVFRMGGDEFCMIAAEADGGAELARRAAEALTESGTSFSVGCSFGIVDVPAEAADADAAMLLADSRMYDHKGNRRPSAAAESQGVLLRALAERNSELGQHNDDVAQLVEAVGHELGLEQGTIVPMLRAAELHDVGKLAIPDTILNKPGPLDEQEWAFMRRHTIVGERIVASAASLRDAAPIVRASHERWDGAGYPDGVAAEAIPLGARIIAVCDAYDAMITNRPYRTRMSEPAALRELRRCSGTQFDPRVVAAFERVMARRADIEAAQAAARIDEAGAVATA
jgi:two-component system, cell cycle response regulator